MLEKSGLALTSGPKPKIRQLLTRYLKLGRAGLDQILASVRVSGIQILIPGVGGYWIFDASLYIKLGQILGFKVHICRYVCFFCLLDDVSCPLSPP